MRSGGGHAGGRPSLENSIGAGKMGAGWASSNPKFQLLEKETGQASW